MWAALFTLDIKWIILQPYSFALSQDQTYPVCVLGLESKPINHSQQFLCAIQLNRWTKFTLKIFVDLMALLLKRLPSTWLVFLVCPPGNLRLGAAPPPLPSEGRAYVVYQPQWETMDVYATFLAFQNNPCPHRSRGSKWMAVGQQIADAHALLGKFKEAPKVSIWFHK